MNHPDLELGAAHASREAIDENIRTDAAVAPPMFRFLSREAPGEFYTPFSPTLVPPRVGTRVARRDDLVLKSVSRRATGSHPRGFAGPSRYRSELSSRKRDHDVGDRRARLTTANNNIY